MLSLLCSFIKFTSFRTPIEVVVFDCMPHSFVSNKKFFLFFHCNGALNSIQTCWMIQGKNFSSLLKVLLDKLRPFNLSSACILRSNAKSAHQHIANFILKEFCSLLFDRACKWLGYKIESLRVLTYLKECYMLSA